MSLGVARARGSSCTITSYCLLARVKVLVFLPPRSTQRRRDVRHRNAEVLGPISIEADRQLRLIDAQVAVDIHQTFDLSSPGKQGVIAFREKVEVRMLNHEVHRASETERRG